MKDEDKSQSRASQRKQYVHRPCDRREYGELKEPNKGQHDWSTERRERVERDGARNTWARPLGPHKLLGFYSFP